MSSLQSLKRSAFPEKPTTTNYLGSSVKFDNRGFPILSSLTPPADNSTQFFTFTSLFSNTLNDEKARIYTELALVYLNSPDEKILKMYNSDIPYETYDEYFGDDLKEISEEEVGLGVSYFMKAYPRDRSLSEILSQYDYPYSPHYLERERAEAEKAAAEEYRRLAEAKLRADEAQEKFNTATKEKKNPLDRYDGSKLR